MSTIYRNDETHREGEAPAEPWAGGSPGGSPSLC